jgi:hypothetical protein
MVEKTIRIKMKGGKTRLQRVQVLASGKFKFIKNIRHSRSTPHRRVKTVKHKSRSYKMARRRVHKRSGKRSFTLPVAPLAGVIGSFAQTAPSGRSLVSDLMTGNGSGFLYDAKEIFTAVDANGKFRPEWAMKTYLPPALGILVHIAASKLGVNRALGRAKVPIIRI